MKQKDFQYVKHQQKMRLFSLPLLNSPNWLQYIGDRQVKTIQDAAAYISGNLIESYQKNGFGLYKMVLIQTGEPIGICGFIKRNYLDFPDLGFAVLPAYEANGYTYEAANTILKYGFSSLHFQSVSAITSTENMKSQNLLSKLGFQQDGSFQPKEEKQPLLLYSLQFINHKEQ